MTLLVGGSDLGSSDRNMAALEELGAALRHPATCGDVAAVLEQEGVPLVDVALPLAPLRALDDVDDDSNMAALARLVTLRLGAIAAPGGGDDGGDPAAAWADVATGAAEWPPTQRR